MPRVPLGVVLIREEYHTDSTGPPLPWRIMGNSVDSPT